MTWTRVLLWKCYLQTLTNFFVIEKLIDNFFPFGWVLQLLWQCRISFRFSTLCSPLFQNGLFLGWFLIFCFDATEMELFEFFENFGRFFMFLGFCFWFFFFRIFFFLQNKKTKQNCQVLSIDTILEHESPSPLLCGCGFFGQNLDKGAKFDLNTRTRTRKTITRSVRLTLSRA